MAIRRFHLGSGERGTLFEWFSAPQPFQEQREALADELIERDPAPLP